MLSNTYLKYFSQLKKNKNGKKCKLENLIANITNDFESGENICWQSEIDVKIWLIFRG